MDPFLGLVLFVAVVGLICWGFTYIPMPSPFHTLIIAAGVIVCVIAFLQFLGVATGVPHVNFIR